MRWIALSDVHERTDHLGRLAAALREAALVILSGDLTMFGGRAEARAVLDRVRAHNRRVLAVPGNTDHPGVLELLEEEGISLHGRCHVVEGVAVYGVGGSNPTPFGTPFELSEDEIGSVIDRGHAAAAEHERRVLVAHPPPWRSGADRLWNGKPVGSTAVRRHVEATVPSLVLSGHIHEAWGDHALGEVPVRNPGPFAAGGWVEIDVTPEGIRSRVRRLDLGTGTRLASGGAALLHKVARIPRKGRRRGGP